MVLPSFFTSCCIYISQPVRVHQLVFLLDFSAALRMTQICFETAQTIINKMADPEAASSSREPSDIQENDKTEEFVEPEKKRRKICKIPDGKSDKLEQRLGGILCCAVCLDLPRAAVYQVCLRIS